MATYRCDYLGSGRVPSSRVRQTDILRDAEEALSKAHAIAQLNSHQR